MINHATSLKRIIYAQLLHSEITKEEFKNYEHFSEQTKTDEEQSTTKSIETVTTTSSLPRFDISVFKSKLEVQILKTLKRRLFLTINNYLNTIDKPDNPDNLPTIIFKNNKHVFEDTKSTRKFKYSWY